MNQRNVILTRTRALKMAQSVHAYVRGNTTKFYEWLGASPAWTSIPQGPPVWICGDCHLGNLGPLADAKHDFEIQIRDLDQPVIPLGKRFWQLETAEREAIDDLFANEDVRDRCLALAGLNARASLRVADAAYWRKGCSSLGRLRFAVLIAISKKPGKKERFALVDIKEAIASAAPRSGASEPSDPAERVVAGARALSPNLGERMIAARLLGKSVFLRELAPQDLKIEVSQFSSKEAVAAAAYLAFIVGVAHARQISKETRLSWRDILIDHRDGKLDAPSWLWRAIVDMAAAHEAG